MKYAVITAAALITVASPTWAQAPSWTYQQQQPSMAYLDTAGYRFVAPTPRDAYRDGLINRWELERLEGPLPQALQGPSVDGNRGGDGGGGFGQ